jgi:hypothetical protein
MLQGILVGLVLATILDPIGVDETLLKAERTADADVLSNLRRNGDCASAVRSVDAASSHSFLSAWVRIAFSMTSSGVMPSAAPCPQWRAFAS